jgi:hypothetical protein
MEVKYRYTRADLEGSRFALFVARALGVRPKLVKMELTPQEAKELGIADGTPKIEFPPGMQNGD